MQHRSRLAAVALAGTMCGGTLLMVAGSAASAAGASPGVGGRALLVPLPGGGSRAAHSVHGFSQIGTINWSGFAQGGPHGTYKSVVDTWHVPTVNTSVSGNQFSSDWVGIGGLNDSSLVQAGTEADNLGGTPLYRAWTEVLPASEDPLTLVVHPGDKITTTVKLATGKWHMTVKDVTTGQSGSRTVSASAAGSSEASAEAIHERPCIADGCTSISDFANLTQTNNVTFDPGKFGHSAKPKTPLMTPAAGATVDQIFMLGNDGKTKIASPSNPDSDNDGFTVADGAVQPAPPPS